MEITKDLCPVGSLLNSPVFLLQVLSIQQLYRINTMYWDDKYGTHSVSTDVRPKVLFYIFNRENKMNLP